ncbi:MAG TPA: hypothetical protein VK921_17295 [Anditalea sp.]|nr:hypothetical protein [Anditalea sp.]
MLLKICDRVISIAFLTYAILKYDIFIFGFGTSMLNNNKDLPLLKFFGKTIISNVAHGSEARPPYINGAKRNSEGGFLHWKALGDMAIMMRSKIEYIENNSSYIIGAPLTSHYLKKPFINLLDIGLPLDLTNRHNNQDYPKNKSVRILHSPSNPYVKGTFEIRQVIAKLSIQGYDIEYIEVINSSNSKVIEELIACDFIIDQLYSDTPMAGFATEAAFYEKPAVVGGYGWDILKEYIDSSNFPPSEICHPSMLEASIIKLIEDKEYRIDLGRRAKVFVTNNWTSELVADKFISLFNEGGKASWYVDPTNINYVQGVGISDIDSQNLIKLILKNYGREGLGLVGKPNLEERFRQFSQRTLIHNSDNVNQNHA